MFAHVDLHVQKGDRLQGLHPPEGVIRSTNDCWFGATTPGLLLDTGKSLAAWASFFSLQYLIVLVRYCLNAK